MIRDVELSDNDFIYLFIFLAVLGLRFYTRAFSSCGKPGPLLIAVRGPLTIAGSLVAEHRLQTRRLSSCGSRAQSLRGMWDLTRPGLEPVSPALAGRLTTTAPPGKPPDNDFKAVVTEVLQQAIIIMLETNEKIENLNKDNKGIQLYIHKLKNLNEMDHFLKKKHTIRIHPKLNDNLNSCITIQKIEFIII